MPDWAAARSRVAPSSTMASANRRRDCAASLLVQAAFRSSAAEWSFRVTSTARAITHPRRKSTAGAIESDRDRDGNPPSRESQRHRGLVLLDVQQLIPLPEAAEFQTRLEEKKAAERKERGEGATLAGRFLAQLAERAALQTDLHRGRAPNAGLGVLFGPAGKAGFSMNYVVARDSSRVELLVQRDDGR